jgi:hypothetical protein
MARSSQVRDEIVVEIVNEVIVFGAVKGAQRCADDVAQKPGFQSSVPDKEVGLRWRLESLGGQGSGTNHVNWAFVIRTRVQQMTVLPHRFTGRLLQGVGLT